MGLLQLLIKITIFLVIFSLIILYLKKIGVIKSKDKHYTMIQKETGITKKVKEGFSFTYLFFGCLVPLYRGHISGFFLSLAVTIFTIGFGNLILCFKYNSIYRDYLIRNGYIIQNVNSNENINVY